MWITWSEPIYEVDSDTWYRAVSHKSHLDVRNPDEILLFESREDCEDYDMGEHARNYDWKARAKREKEERDKRRGKE